KYTMTANNEKQADVLRGATVLTNTLGTASGQWISGKYDCQEKIIILLPGPPHELKSLFEKECVERLRAKLPPAFLATRELRVAMMGESQCDSRAAPIYQKYADVQTTILAGAGEIQLHLKAQSSSQQIAQDRVDKLAGELEDELGDYVFSSHGETLEQIVGYFLQMRSATLAAAESCTGGLLAERITSVGGSSRYFVGGAVVYSNDLKTEFAGVAPELIAEYGAVSKEVAEALALGIRERCDSTLG